MLGGLYHVAISMVPVDWERAGARLDEAGVPIADPLGEIYGAVVG